MKCDYCQSKEIPGIDIGNCAEIAGGHLICDDSFSYLNTFCELEEALAAAKTTIHLWENNTEEMKERLKILSRYNGTRGDI